MCTKDAHWGETDYTSDELDKGKHIESTKSVTGVVVVVKPQTLAQSNKELTRAPFSWSIDLAWSSNAQLLRSVQIVHIKHKGTRFQTPELCFPNQFLHPNNRSTTLPTITHWIPKDWNTKLHNSYATLQCNKRWSTISPLRRHMQHQSTNWIPSSH